MDFASMQLHYHECVSSLIYMCISGSHAIFTYIVSRFCFSARQISSYDYFPSVDELFLLQITIYL